MEQRTAEEALSSNTVPAWAKQIIDRQQQSINRLRREIRTLKGDNPESRTWVDDFPTTQCMFLDDREGVVFNLAPAGYANDRGGYLVRCAIRVKDGKPYLDVNADSELMVQPRVTNSLYLWIIDR